MDVSDSLANRPQWFAMRFLYNSQPATRKQLEADGIETFYPMRTVAVSDRHGRKIRSWVPVIQDLYFVHSTRDVLDPYVQANPYFQYRFRMGGAYREPIIVPERQMEMFIKAVEDSKNPLYFTPDELNVEKGTRIRLIGGDMDGYEGILMRVKGSRTKRLLVEIAQTLISAVEVSPDLIEVL